MPHILQRYWLKDPQNWEHTSGCEIFLHPPVVEGVLTPTRETHHEHYFKVEGDATFFFFSETPRSVRSFVFFRSTVPPKNSYLNQNRKMQFYSLCEQVIGWGILIYICIYNGKYWGKQEIEGCIFRWYWKIATPPIVEVVLIPAKGAHCEHY